MNKDGSLLDSLNAITSNQISLRHNLAELDTIKNHVDIMRTNIMTIDAQYHTLQNSLQTLNSHNSWDIWVRASTVMIALISAIIAIRLFYMNRNKDFHIKKAELAGEIYGSIFEFKRLKLVLFKAELMSFVHTMAIVSEGITDDKRKYLDKLFGIVMPDDPINKTTELNTELNIVRMNLLNKIGQYRFYVDKAEKAALKFHTNAVTIDRAVPLLYAGDDHSFEYIDNNYWRDVDKEVENEKALLEKQFGAIESIIEDYDKYVKNIKLF